MYHLQRYYKLNYIHIYIHIFIYIYICIELYRIRVFDIWDNRQYCVIWMCSNSLTSMSHKHLDQWGILLGQEMVVYVMNMTVPLTCTSCIYLLRDGGIKCSHRLLSLACNGFGILQFIMVMELYIGLWYISSPRTMYSLTPFGPFSSLECRDMEGGL